MSAEKTHPIPQGFSTITPFLMAKNAAGLQRFLARAFDAETIYSINGLDGRVMHAQLRIGDAMVMLAGSMQERKGTPAALSLPLPMSLYIYAPDVDGLYRRAIAAGASSVLQPADRLSGDRSAGVRDTEGNLWWIATHVEDIAPDEIARRTIESESYCKAA